MKKLVLVGILIFASGCLEKSSTPSSQENDNQPNTNNNEVTWADRFPAVWSSAFSKDVDPSTVSYEQFVNTVGDALKSNQNFRDSVKGEKGDNGATGAIGPKGDKGVKGDTGLSPWEKTIEFYDNNNYLFACNDQTPCRVGDITPKFSTLYDGQNNIIGKDYRSMFQASEVKGKILKPGFNYINDLCEYRLEINQIPELSHSSRNFFYPTKVDHSRIIFPSATREVPNQNGFYTVGFTGSHHFISGDIPLSVGYENTTTQQHRAVSRLNKLLQLVKKATLWSRCSLVK